MGLDRREPDREMGGDKSFGGFGVVDDLCLDSTPSVCKKSKMRATCVNGCKDGKEGENGERIGRGIEGQRGGLKTG